MKPPVERAASLPAGDAGGAPPLDKHGIYEIAVQDPSRLVPFLRAIHGGEPRVLGEDFCGTAALSRAWVRLVEGGRAIAIDHDASVLERARADERVQVIQGDVCAVPDPALHTAEVIFAGNFSIGELHTRERLTEYLRRTRARLAPRGLFACDVYGGATAYTVGSMRRDRFLSDGTRVRYTWEQRAADPASGMVVNAMHFLVERDGQVVIDMPDAFVYRWRLWALPELRDALRESGFQRFDIYDELPGTEGSAEVRTSPAAGGGELAPSFVVCVAAR